MKRSAVGATVAFERVALLMKLNEKNSPGWVEHFNYPGEWVGVVYRREGDSVCNHNIHCTHSTRESKVSFNCSTVGLSSETDQGNARVHA